MISSAADVGEPIAEDIRKILADRYQATGIDIESPDEAPFALGAHYEKRNEVDDGEFRSEWRKFEETLKTEARYFSRDAELILWSIFEDLDGQITSGGYPVIVAGGLGTAISELYRARTVQTVTKLRTVLSRPDKEVGPPPPPPSAAVAGRMNARGISVFYGSTDPEVAIAEIRPPVGSQVVVGRFDVIRPVRLLLLIRLFQQATSGSGQPSDGGSPRSDAPRISSYLVGLCPAPSPSSVWNAAIGVFRRL